MWDPFAKGSDLDDTHIGNVDRPPSCYFWRTHPVAWALMSFLLSVTLSSDPEARIGTDYGPCPVEDQSRSHKCCIHIHPGIRHFSLCCLFFWWTASSDERCLYYPGEDRPRLCSPCSTFLKRPSSQARRKSPTNCEGLKNNGDDFQVIRAKR